MAANPTLSPLDLEKYLICCFPKIHFNIVVLFSLRFPMLPPPLWLTDQNSACFSLKRVLCPTHITNYLITLTILW